jgi:hypothetical protein
VQSHSANMMNSFQLTGDSSNRDVIASLGYDADDDTAVGEHSVSSADEDEESTPNRKCHPSPMMRVPCCRRKRRRHEKPLLSIVHPDLDSGLTTHIAARQQQLLRHRRPIANSEPPMSLYDLSHMLENYFQQQHASYEAPASVSDEDENFPELSRRRRGNRHSQARISYSSERLFLDDALGFSSDARILVEASPLHRVVHTNAAFCSLTAEQEPSHDKQASAMTKGVQERFRTSTPNSSLGRIVSAMFDDRAVTVYPVQDSDGSGVIRYYLVEHIAATAVATVATSKKRLASTDIAVSAQAVG